MVTLLEGEIAVPLSSSGSSRTSCEDLDGHFESSNPTRVQCDAAVVSFSWYFQLAPIGIRVSWAAKRIEQNDSSKAVMNTCRTNELFSNFIESLGLEHSNDKIETLWFDVVKKIAES